METLTWSLRWQEILSGINPINGIKVTTIKGQYEIMVLAGIFPNNEIILWARYSFFPLCYSE
jgi:hypothetical protein